ncbi:MAG: hypothetical protein KatS3mg038_3874 [Candidatus Kapaibacterium sp.]|nr:MAG: hypothetical protein KatS3mg038_0293 [Candidatus Kapabacteria bacterium]GIV49833.1 MAG: hypothetical protein KatS3mg038_0354 [Candidatus Kapabacteria bacterium]GIV49893.1 MAG: hypothetical protein KatS3mg038_0414 [Candidatus Kapabacteria bacterium]GIV49955.1 MAG: hypothetical protein KatS3mg038_0476 [Candidatus Kapabacteria bacterium]GIV50778.1 MAG: hypothetical protein KatS3mg038_1299 [Candidatus Kapabacteria bacterium]
MTWQALLLLGVVAGLAAVDVIVIGIYGAQHSLSLATYQAAREYPVIAFMLGVIAGHVFWPLR